MLQLTVSYSLRSAELRNSLIASVLFFAVAMIGLGAADAGYLAFDIRQGSAPRRAGSPPPFRAHMPPTLMRC